MSFSFPWRRPKNPARTEADPFDDEFQRKLESLALVTALHREVVVPDRKQRNRR